MRLFMHPLVSASIKQHKMPVLRGGPNRLGGQCRRALAARTPDGVDGRLAELLDQARPDGDALRAAAIRQVGHRAGDARAVRTHVLGPVVRGRGLHSVEVELMEEPRASAMPRRWSVRERTKVAVSDALCSLPHSAVGGFRLLWLILKLVLHVHPFDHGIPPASGRIAGIDVSGCRGSLGTGAAWPPTLMRAGHDPAAVA